MIDDLYILMTYKNYFFICHYTEKYSEYDEYLENYLTTFKEDICNI